MRQSEVKGIHTMFIVVLLIAHTALLHQVNKISNIVKLDEDHTHKTMQGLFVSTTHTILARLKTGIAEVYKLKSALHPCT